MGLSPLFATNMPLQGGWGAKGQRISTAEKPTESVIAALEYTRAPCRVMDGAERIDGHSAVSLRLTGG